MSRVGAERTDIALDRFFTEANLTALRELALWTVAQRVEGQLEDAVVGNRLPLVTERVLVLVDDGPATPRAIRRGARLASAIHGALLAVVVDTPESVRRSFDRGLDMQQAIDDAVDLDDDVVRVEAADVLAGLERVARTRHVTHVVLPHQGAGALGRLLERPPAERLLQRLPDIEVHLVGAPPRT